MIRSVVLSFMAYALSVVAAADQPQWGEAWSRNMVSAATGLADGFDPATKQNLRWVAELGTDTYSTPIVAGGRVYIGTNNNNPRNPLRTGDCGVLMCFDEVTGTLLWQLVVPKRWEDNGFDWARVGMCSTAVIDGERAYIMSNRGELICLDVHGQANGNDGPFMDEGALATSPRQPGQQPRKDAEGIVQPEPLVVIPVEGPRAQVTPLDADVIWRTDVVHETGIWPHDAAHSTILIRGNHLYLNSGTGVDNTHRKMRAPESPSLLVVDKRDGRILAREDEGIAPNIFHNTLSGPSLGTINGREVIFFCAGNGIIYGIEPLAEDPPPGQRATLKKIFSYDPDPKAPKTGVQRFHGNTREGPTNLYGMPVFVGGRLYVAGGGDVYWGKNISWLKCLSFSDGADKPVLEWTCALGRHTLSTPAVADGLAYVSDSDGLVHCIDVKTGERVWSHEMSGPVWASPLVADHKVFVGTRRGQYSVLAAGREKRVLSTVELLEKINATTTAANGTFYVATMSKLFAVRRP